MSGLEFLIMAVAILAIILLVRHCCAVNGAEKTGVQGAESPPSAAQESEDPNFDPTPCNNGEGSGGQCAYK